ncbi:MAG TPA: hypothetical protein VFV96_01390 [Verrucomicrobiae bacterium]|nr:hypothetical protein [Verrucomicrobiae bacterium]
MAHKLRLRLFNKCSIERPAKRLGTVKQQKEVIAMGLAAYIQSIINDQGPNSMLRGRLELARDQARTLEDQVAQLQAGYGSAYRALANNSVSTSFVEHRGALFKRTGSGSYEKRVFCPSCKLPMTSIKRVLPYSCNRCQYSAEFAGIDLQAVMMTL